MSKPEFNSRVRGEIEALHAFFVDWLGARVPQQEEVFQERFLARMHPGFALVDPNAERSELGTLSHALRIGYGCNPGFAIQIREVRVIDHPQCVVATYEEWQQGALAPASATSGRLASAVLAPAERGFQWLHVHETWLPKQDRDAKLGSA